MIFVYKLYNIIITKNSCSRYIAIDYFKIHPYLYYSFKRIDKYISILSFCSVKLSLFFFELQYHCVE